MVLILGLFRNANLVGTVVFALPPRETMKRYKVDLVWELARLFILDTSRLIQKLGLWRVQLSTLNSKEKMSRLLSATLILQWAT